MWELEKVLSPETATASLCPRLALEDASSCLARLNSYHFECGRLVHSENIRSNQKTGKEHFYTLSTVSDGTEDAHFG